MEGHILDNVHDNRGMSFDVDETLYFEKGQGISEMVSISLEPDILVQSYNEYVQVRGIILLQGEYRKVNDDEENVSSYNNQFTKYIEKVMDLEEGIASFSHRIPVEVSIPTYRVSNINDITVVVESFDYELPNQHILKVNSSLHIYGINGSDQTYATEEEVEEVNHHGHDAEVINDKDVQREKEEQKVVSFKKKNHETKLASNDSVTSENDKLHNNKDASHEQEKDTQIEAIDVSNPKSVERTEFVNDEKEIDIQLKENEDEEMEEDQKDVLFLTEFFSEEEEEVTYTKMKIHITQEDDTIESISERYE